MYPKSDMLCLDESPLPIGVTGSILSVELGDDDLVGIYVAVLVVVDETAGVVAMGESSDVPSCSPQNLIDHEFHTPLLPSRSSMIFNFHSPTGSSSLFRSK